MFRLPDAIFYLVSLAWVQFLKKVLKSLTGDRLLLLVVKTANVDTTTATHFYLTNRSLRSLPC